MLEKDIKFNVKGRIVKGSYSPNGEISFGDDTEGRTGGYYIHIWPNDGTKWPGTDDNMVYDWWYESWENLLINIEDEDWEVEWFNEEQQKADALKYAKYQLTDEEKEAERQRVNNFIEKVRLRQLQYNKSKSE